MLKYLQSIYKVYIFTPSNNNDMKTLKTKLYLKRFDKKNIGDKYCLNARIATDNALIQLKEIGFIPVEYGNYGIQLKKSPYSKSCYLQIWETDNNNPDCPIWVIRISNHMPNQLPPNCVLNIWSDNGDYIINSAMKYNLKKCIKELTE